MTGRVGVGLAKMEFVKGAITSFVSGPITVVVTGAMALAVAGIAEAMPPTAAGRVPTVEAAAGV